MHLTLTLEIMYIHAGPLKVGINYTMLHPCFLGIVVAEVVVGVCKGSQSKSRLELLTLCGEGEQMVQVTRVLYPSTPVMQYESRHNPLVTTLEDACKTNEKIYMLWECKYLMPQDG
jgi:hypothetical protein